LTILTMTGSIAEQQHAGNVMPSIKAVLPKQPVFIIETLAIANDRRIDTM